MNEAGAAPALELGTPRGRRALLATVLGSSVVMLNATVVNVALPRLGRDLGTDLVGLQWVLNGYLITLSSLLLLGGALGDRLGRRRVYVLGLLGYAAASALCALSWNLGALVSARALQGVAGAVVTPGSLALIQAGFRSSDRAAAIGAWSALGGVAVAIGPLLGGWLVDFAGWRTIFWMEIPLALAAAWLAFRVLPESRARGAAEQPLDLPGTVLITVAIAGVCVALLRAGDVGVDWAVSLGAAGGLGALAAFVLVERRSPAPLVPPELVTNRTFAAANGVTLVVYAALGGVFFLLVVHLQTVLGYSALEAGAATLPVTLLMLALSARAGALAQRIGPRLPLTVGPVILAFGMVLMGRIGAGDRYVPDVLPSVVVFGLGLAAIVAPVTATALAAADGDRAGVASAVNNTVARVAQLLAVAVLPLAAGMSGVELTEAARFASGFTRAMWITAGVALAGALLAWTTIPHGALETRPDESELEHCPSCPVAGPPPVLAGRGDVNLPPSR